MLTFDPDQVLYRSWDRELVGLDGVIGGGLDRDDRIRYPALRWLLEHGEPVHRLHACVVLASWGVREGLLTVAEWARDPDAVPWAGAPVTFDRFTGADDAFAQLTDALCCAGEYRELTEVGAVLRALAVRELLVVHHRVFLDRSMMMLLDLDPALAAASRPEIEWAVEHTISAGRGKPEVARQAAFLLGSFAALDDAAAATAAATLLAEHPDSERVLREVALAMSSGTGPATMTVLERLGAWPLGAVRREAAEWIARRGEGR